MGRYEVRNVKESVEVREGSLRESESRVRKDWAKGRGPRRMKTALSRFPGVFCMGAEG